MYDQTILLALAIASMTFINGALSTNNDNSHKLYNSSIACTRGKDITLHTIECKDENNHPSGLIAVRRLFYGTPPISSNCHRSAPYGDCCGQDFDHPNCVFHSDYKLSNAVLECSGKSECLLYGRSAMSARGKCDKTIYPDITSLSFMEYQCIALGDLNNLCPRETTTLKQGQQLYLDSNYDNKNPELKSGDSCSCAVATKCGATISVDALLVQLRRINKTDCVEEMYFQDLKNAPLEKTYTCNDHDPSSGINNQVLFTSSSNVMRMKLHIFEKHNGKILLSVQSSDIESNLTLKCGPTLTVNNFISEHTCPGEALVTLPPDPIETTTLTSPGNGNSEGQNEEVDDRKEKVNTDSNESDLHPGAIAGIILAVLGITLFLVQVIFFLIRRRVKRQDDLRTLDGRSNISQISSEYHQNDAFGNVYPDSFHTDVTENTDNGSYVDFDEHVYDVANEAAGESQKPPIYASAADPDGLDKTGFGFDNHVYNVDGDGDSLSSFSPPPSYRSSK